MADNIIESHDGDNGGKYAKAKPNPNPKINDNVNRS